MEKITFEKFINLIKKYNDDEEDINQIKKHMITLKIYMKVNLDRVENHI